MARSHAAVAVGALALAIAVILIPVSAHEGHGTPAAAAFDPNAPKRVSRATSMAIGLETAEVDFGQVESVVRLTGMVRSLPDATFAVAPTYAGVVRSIAVQPGDRVTRGMVIAELEIPEVARMTYDLNRYEVEHEKLISDGARAGSQAASLEIDVRALGLSAELSEAEVQRLAGAGESVPANLLAQRQSDALKLRADVQQREVALTQARSEVQSLRRQADATRASIDALRAALPGSNQGSDPTGRSLADPARPGLLRFAAPIDGVVVARGATLGAGVSAGMAIVTIANFDRVYIEGEIPEGLIDRVGSVSTPKARVRRGANGPVIGEGVGRLISPMIDATKRTAHLIVEVENAAGLLRQGQCVELSVVLSANDAAVVVPVSAIVKEGALQYVFVMEGKGENEVFEKRDVATGARDDRVVEIKTGLVPGDVIAVRGAFSLSQLRGVVPGSTEPAAPGTPGAAHQH